MPRPLQPATRGDVESVRLALAQLRSARDSLQRAQCGLAVAKVAAAIKSTDGALRHVERRERVTSSQTEES